MLSSAELFNEGRGYAYRRTGSLENHRPRGSGCWARHLSSFAVQFRMTDIGALSACFSCVLIRNLCPSRLTS
jgi:hypothetical protein